MRKTILTTILIIFSITIYSQSVQLHQNLGKNRNFFTTSIDMFKPDNWGNTFFFVCMNYGEGNVNGVSLAYWEIARGLKFWDAPINVQVEYNGGFGQWDDGNFSGVFQMNDSWLGGLSYSWNTTDFTKGASAKALYKYIQGKHNASFQFTLTWFINSFNNKLSFVGFFDFWREDNTFMDDKTEYVILSKAQLWYNFTKNFSLGSELEPSYNFAGIKGFNLKPTVGAKWTF